MGLPPLFSFLPLRYVLIQPVTGQKIAFRGEPRLSEDIKKLIYSINYRSWIDSKLEAMVPVNGITVTIGLKE
ncbi:hypothetical protein BDV37DRAFT_239262 [Aspergillus pseudonomiae]|uniref:Uncharacterized protein n=1 Tax=Aspergillus pseudonomiae TaxID=1506151 RepID=A0A5N7DPC6_9EURO|nr:uncharacterized protein BDV37DRAFT_239262 [Aspergillus pseudonomiae]KAE8408266.1 hypothetical protein BDV37DRAFT_239262 [Aspergillus pseudonomiae]